MQELSEEEENLLNLDGKLVCRVKREETEQQLHLLAVQEAEKNLTIQQTALRAGENEISAVNRWLKNLIWKKKSSVAMRSLHKLSWAEKSSSAAASMCGNDEPIKDRSISWQSNILSSGRINTLTKREI